MKRPTFIFYTNWFHIDFCRAAVVDGLGEFLKIKVAHIEPLESGLWDETSKIAGLSGENLRSDLGEVKLEKALLRSWRYSRSSLEKANYRCFSRRSTRSWRVWFNDVTSQ